MSVVFAGRDTFEQKRMRQAMGSAPVRRLTAADAWQRLGDQTRMAFCVKALGAIQAQPVALLAWDDIPVRERAKIGAEVRRVAQALV